MEDLRDMSPENTANVACGNDPDITKPFVRIDRECYTNIRAWANHGKELHQFLRENWWLLKELTYENHAELFRELSRLRDWTGK